MCYHNVQIWDEWPGIKPGSSNGNACDKTERISEWSIGNTGALEIQTTIALQTLARSGK